VPDVQQRGQQGRWVGWLTPPRWSVLFLVAQLHSGLGRMPLVQPALLLGPAAVLGLV
jgi:cell division inhibitor SulA